MIDYTENLAREWSERLDSLEQAYEHAKVSLVSEIEHEYLSVDLGRAHSEATLAAADTKHRHSHLLSLSSSRQKNAASLSIAAAKALSKPIVPRNTAHLDIERARAREIAARHRLKLLDPVHVEPRKSSRPLTATDFSNTCHHRSVAVKAAWNRPTACHAAEIASRQASLRVIHESEQKVIQNRHALTRGKQATREIVWQKVFYPESLFLEQKESGKDVDGYQGLGCET